MHRVARRRDAAHRAIATPPAHVPPTQRNADDTPRPPPRHAFLDVVAWRVDRRRSHRSSTGAGTHLAVAHRRRARCAPHRLSRSSPTRTVRASRPAPAPRQETGTERCAARAQRPPQRVANTLPPRCWPAPTSRGLRIGVRRDVGDGLPGWRCGEWRADPPTTRRPRRATPKKKPAALGGRFGCRDGRSAQWPSSSSSSAYSSGDSSSFNCSASSASSTRIQPSP